MDEEVFRSDAYQRVFQYLRGYTGGVNLDSFQYNGTTEGTCQDFLEMVL